MKITEISKCSSIFDKLIHFLNRAPVDEIYLTKEMSEKLTASETTIRRCVAKLAKTKYIYKVGARDFFGNPKAIMALKKQVGAE